MRPKVMFRWPGRLMILLVMSAMLQAGQETHSVRLVADQWCPYNCEPGAESPGFLLDITAQALAMEGVNVEYRLLPWPRAQREVRRGLHDGIVGTGYEENPDFVFPGQPLAWARHSFFTRPDSEWRFQGLESLQGIRLGVISGYSYGGLDEDYIQLHKGNGERLVVLHGDGALPRLMGMLKRGYIDALIEDERVLAYYRRQNPGLAGLRFAGLAYEEAIYVAFSPTLKDSHWLAQALERGVKALRESGELEAIMANYR